MRPFPPRFMSDKDIPIITPRFIGFTRGIDGNIIDIKQTVPKTSLDMIKCLRSASHNAMPIKDVSSEIYSGSNF